MVKPREKFKWNTTLYLIHVWIYAYVFNPEGGKESIEHINLGKRETEWQSNNPNPTIWILTLTVN